MAVRPRRRTGKKEKVLLLAKTVAKDFEQCRRGRPLPAMTVAAQLPLSCRYSCRSVAAQ